MEIVEGAVVGVQVSPAGQIVVVRVGVLATPVVKIMSLEGALVPEAVESTLKW